MRRFAVVGALVVGLLAMAGPAYAALPVVVTGKMADALGLGYAGQVLGVQQSSDPSLHEIVQFKSLDEFRAAVLAPGQMVMYDVEHWGATPDAEWEHPAASMREFITEAHERGYIAIVAPGGGVAAYSLGCHQRTKETPWASYVRCFGLLPADYLLVQQQGRQCDTDTYAAHIAQIAARSPAGIIAEMTLYPDRPCATVPRLLADIAAVGAFTAGVSVWSTPNVEARVTTIRDFDQQVRMMQQLLAKLPAKR